MTHNSYDIIKSAQVSFEVSLIFVTFSTFLLIMRYLYNVISASLSYTSIFSDSDGRFIFAISPLLSYLVYVSAPVMGDTIGEIVGNLVCLGLYCLRLVNTRTESIMRGGQDCY